MTVAVGSAPLVSSWADVEGLPQRNVFATLGSNYEHKVVVLVELGGDYFAVMAPNAPRPWLASPDLVHCHLHRLGQLTQVMPLELGSGRKAQAPAGIAFIGKLVPLPVHAHLSTYDVGDQVVVVEGLAQGLTGRVVSSAHASVTISTGPHSQGVAHRIECVAAVLPNGDMSRHQDILPGVVKYPPGSLVWAKGERWLVARWREGLAEVVNFDSPERRTFRKAELAYGG